MRLSKIVREAMALPEHQRVRLVCKLLESLPRANTDVSDKEVARRERELESGSVEALSHDEFVRRVRRART